MNGLKSIQSSGNLPLNDFIEYWSACRVFLNGGNPYDPQELIGIQRSVGWKEEKPLMMWNPPLAIPLMLPFSLHSFWTGRSLFYLFSLLSIFMIADWFWRLYTASVRRRWLSWLAVFLLVGFLLYVANRLVKAFDGKQEVKPIHRHGGLTEAERFRQCSNDPSATFVVDPKNLKIYRGSAFPPPLEGK